MTRTIPQYIQDARMLANRLERLSADSHWAHRASGLRGALLRNLEDWDRQAVSGADEPADVERFQIKMVPLIERGFTVLHKAAREIRTPDTQYD